MNLKRPSDNANKVIVTFEIPASIWAERINLVGDFNNWDAESLPFDSTKRGNWKVEVELEAGGEYRFGYLLEGVHWRYDWHADKYARNTSGVFAP